MTNATASPVAASAPTTVASASLPQSPNLLASGALNCDITGKVEDFPFLLFGLFDVDGTDEHVLITQESPDEPFVYEELTIGSTTWSRANGRPWGRPLGGADAVARLRQSIDQASGWTELGPQEGASRPLHRFKAAGTPVSSSDFGLEYPEGFDSSLSLEIDTADDGSPAAMHISGASLTADLTCRRRALSRSTAPSNWRPVALSQGVSIEVPEDWELNRSDPTKLTVLGPDRQWITVQGASANELTLEEWTSDGAAYFAREWLAVPGVGTSISVADQEAVLATWHLPLDGQQSLFLDVSAVRDGWGYDIEFFSQSGREPADRALFEQILTTVVFGEP